MTATGPTLDQATIAALLAPVAAGDAAAAAAWPGPSRTRQPVQVLYVPADRVTDTLLADLRTESLRLLDTHAPDPVAFAAAMDMADVDLAARVRARVATKLASEPVEDLRVDVEDGYLGRDAATEAHDVEAAARTLAAAHADGTAPPFFGIRVKSFTDGLAPRSVASLDRFVTTLLEVGGDLPAGLRITFPKIVAVEHVAAFAAVCDRLESALGLPQGRLRFECQIETTASVIGADGRIVLRDLREAAEGRLAAVHLGVYDLTAGLGLPPGEQRPEHPACDLVRQLMQLTFAGTEVERSDGSVNAVPASDDTAEVVRVWRRHTAAVRHGLAGGEVQGWDLHVAHLVSRYATVYAHLLDGIDDVLARLRAWERGEASGGQLDEPATVRRLQAQVDRAIACGALDPHAG
ncbi:MAG: hypothetical protein JJT89_04625 [Nitriliruptoraceae bacterium]|nr:hypothetical protein [Nitriliruptoraceae bacterium]